MAMHTFVVVLSALAACSVAWHNIQRGGSCTRSGSRCASGLVCTGRPHDKRCVVPMSEGKRCNTDPFWVCESTLTCVSNVCRRFVPVNGDCTASGSTCVAGTACVGPSNRKQCRVPMTEGKRCNTDPYWVCRSDLSCVSNVCKTPRDGSCLPRGSVCVSGTVCAGTVSRKRCVVPMTVGRRCNVDPFWVCETGLTCDGNICKLPKGQPCDGAEDVCVSGTACVGVRRRKLCSPVRGEGQRCGDIGFLQCSAGLACLNNRCVRGTIPAGGDCSDPWNACAGGNVCGGPSNRRICVKPMGDGQRCNTDPYWVCGPGLRCRHHRCRQY